MPCLSCIAVFAAVAGVAVSAKALVKLERALQSLAVEAVRKASDSAAATRYEFAVPPPEGARPAGASVPVAVTVYKPQKRVRIQVLTHDLSREQAIAVQDRIAAACGLTVVDRSNPEAEAKVHEAVDMLAASRTGEDDGVLPAKEKEGGP